MLFRSVNLKNGRDDDDIVINLKNRINNENMKIDYKNRKREKNHSAEDDTWKEVVTEEETASGKINNQLNNIGNKYNNDNNNNNNNNKDNYDNNNEIRVKKNHSRKKFSTTAPTTPRREKTESVRPRARASSFMSIFSPFAFAPLSLSTVFSQSNSDSLYDEYAEKRFSNGGLQNSTSGISEDKISPNVTVRQKRFSGSNTGNSVTNKISSKKYVRTKASTLEPFSIRKSSSVDENEMSNFKKHLSFSTQNDHVIESTINKRGKRDTTRDDDNYDMRELRDHNDEGEGFEFDSMSDSGDERGSEDGSEAGDKDPASNGEVEEHSFPNILFSQTEILGLRLMFSLFDRFVSSNFYF